MSDDRRKFLVHAITGGLGIGLVGAISHARGAGVSNEIVVGNGGDYPDVASALATITDASRTNPYLIRVLPGVYNSNFTTKSWVSIVGSGRTATIFEGSVWQGIKVAGSSVTLSDFSVYHTGSNPNHTALARSGPASEIILFNIDIEQSGPGCAIRNAKGDTKLTWWLSNLKIRSEGTALELGLQTYCDNLKVLLHGNYSGQPHVGVKVIGNSCRVFLSNCRIGTGYWWGYDENGFQANTVSGDDDVIGIWVPAGNRNCKIEVHGLESFCRNETTTNPGVRVSVIRLEDSWLRAFGCFGQAENPMDWAICKTVHQSQNGKIEQYACRFTDVEGNTTGVDILPTQTFTYLDNFYTFNKFEGGLHRVDTSGGDVELVLHGHRLGEAPGETHFFKIIRGDNKLTLRLSAGNRLEGSTVDPVLQGLYASMKLIWDGEEWIYG
jgi:hypothetical protein